MYMIDSEGWLILFKVGLQIRLFLREAFLKTHLSEPVIFFGCP